MRRVAIIIGMVMWLLWPIGVRAQSLGGYAINSIESRITIQKDTKMNIREAIKVNFLQERHGIYRYIPTIYRSGNRMLNAHIRVISVNAPYTTSRQGNNFVIKIGDPDKNVYGNKEYVIEYEVANMITRWEDHDELYWNTVGSNWDTNAEKVRVSVSSPYANVLNKKCFAGPVGTVDERCQITDNEFTSLVPVGQGSDMTIVIGLDKNNQLVFPTLMSQIVDQIALRWYYILVFIPALAMGVAWWKKGRDVVAGYDNYLPYVYSPIKGVTPAQAGLLVDQRVNVADLTAEILELARRKYLKINKIGKDDFEFIKLKEADDELQDYQQYLLNNLEPKLSQMKQKFYSEFAKYKTMVSENAAGKGWFDGSPEKIRGKWVGGFVLITIALFILFQMKWLLNDYWILAAGVVSWGLCLMFTVIMPRRTASGHKLYRDLTGLKYYINEGKWRYENFEKNLFIEEILPIAVALGVVTKLAQQMKELGMQSPGYVSAFGANMASWNSFNSMATATTTAPGSSGGWSGGSGFSGGSSGGGGGGGGGGSW